MKRFLFFFLAATVMVVSLCAFPGCATTQPKNPQQAILATRVAYTDAVEAASTYGNPAYIPLCSSATPTQVVCANPAIVKQIKIAKDAAKPVIDGAEATVLDPKFDASKADAIVISAQNALKALQAITDALHLKAPPAPPK